MNLEYELCQMSLNIADEEPYRGDYFSQEGEDVYLLRTMYARTDGFYVDVGAHHPFRFSNTYAFYKKGWRGINIEANPHAKALFDQHRPRDINLNCLVSEAEGKEYQFDMYNEAALNSAVPGRREGILTASGYALEETIMLKARRLDSILDEFMPQGVNIDFLSIDVEGLDLEVINSSNWSKYRPEFVLAETYINMEDPSSNNVCMAMKEHGYKLRSFLHLTAVFVQA